VKPANVMLDSRNRVVVTDFGIAKALTEGTLTASGSVIGTPYFMSPEQGMGKPVSGRSDQYSVGVMAYRMLSGQVPFEGDSAIDILHKHCMMQAPALEGLRPGLPKHAYRAIHKALAKDPEKRFPTVGALIESLQRETRLTPSTDEMAELATVVVQGLSTLPGPAAQQTDPEARTEILGARRAPPAAPRRSKSRRRSPAVLVTAAAVVVLGGAAGGIWIASRGGGSAPIANRADTVVPPPAPTVIDTPPTPPPAPTTALVTVRGVPQNAEITAAGVTRAGSSFELSAGEHLVRITAPGYEPFETTLEVTAGEPTTLVYTGRLAQRAPPARPPDTRPQRPVTQPPPVVPETGLLQIRIVPAAVVYVDGVSKGEQARLEEELSVGEHVLRIEKEGYQTIEQRITITAGQPWRNTFRLQQR
jgi:serine/threonine-protein kinase